MRFQSAALGVVLLTCAACVQFQSQPLDPVVEYDAVVARGRSPVAEPSETMLAPTAAFPLSESVSAADGLDLSEVNALALFHAPTLVAARSRLRLRGAELLRAGLLSNPGLFFGPRIATDGSGDIFPASLSMEIPLGGRLEAEEHRAAAEIEAARCLLLESEARALVTVKRSFIELEALSRREKLLERLVRDAESVRERTRRLVEGGEEDGVALALSILERDELLRELRTARVESNEGRFRLASATGLLPSGDLEFTTAAVLLQLSEPPPLDRDRLLAHPILKSLEAAYAAAEHGLEVEIARQYPTLSIGPEFESAAGSPSLGVGLSITLPIFDRNEGGIAVAEEQRAAGREAWHAALVEIAEREGRARARFEEARSALAELRATTIPAADEADRALEARLRAGQSSLVEVLAVRRSIARARLREVELLREAATTALDVLWYSGRLFGEGASEEETR